MTNLSMLDINNTRKLLKDKKGELLFTFLVDKCNGIIVGSRAWGGYSEDSDFDLIVKIDKENLITEFIKSLGLEIKNNLYMNNKSQYIVTGNCQINIIYLSDKMINYWNEASTMMYNFPSNKIANKKLRRLVFTMLVDILHHLGE